MKKQQKTYLLLIIVFIVWGSIGYQIFKGLNPEKNEDQIVKTNRFVLKSENQTEFYKVTPMHRDPFLGKLYVEKKKPKKQKKETEKIIFPNVIYNGIVKGNKSVSYILTINGQQELVLLGQAIGEIKLIKANQKEAVIRFKGINKTILLQ